MRICSRCFQMEQSRIPLWLCLDPFETTNYCWKLQICRTELFTHPSAELHRIDSAGNGRLCSCTPHCCWERPVVLESRVLLKMCGLETSTQPLIYFRYYLSPSQFKASSKEHDGVQCVRIKSRVKKKVTTKL